MNKLSRSIAGCLIGIIIQFVSAGIAFADNCSTLQDYELLQNLTNTSNTLKIQIQNLSPYDMVLSSNPFTDQLGGDIGSSNTTVIAPSGLPSILPATNYDVCNPVASTMAPIVLAWQDSVAPNPGHGISEIKIGYTIKNVNSTDMKGHPVTGDAPFLIDMVRCNPPAPAQGNINIFFQILEEMYYMVKVILEPESPKSWISALYHTGELIKEARFAANNQKTTANTIRMSAYATMSGCTPGTYPVSGWVRQSDSLAAQTPQGCPPANDIIVSIMNFRGSYGSGDGTNLLPYSIITIYDQAHFNTAYLSLAIKSAAKAGKLGSDPQFMKLSNFVSAKGSAGLRAFANALKGASPQDYANLNGIISNLMANQPPDGDQNALIDSLISKVETQFGAQLKTCPTGACTYQDGTCHQATLLDCENANGRYGGDGNICPTAACCTPSGCKAMTMDDCSAAGGDFMGAGSACTDSLCNGGCCWGEDCYITNKFNCPASWLGYGSNCPRSCMGAKKK
jgi:hypothetical protein